MENEKGLVKMSNSVPDILATLENELSALRKVSGSNFRTNGMIESWDLKKETDIEKMGKKFGQLLASKEFYDKAMKELDQTTYPVYTVGGSPIEEWAKDFKLRISIVTQSEREKQLKEAIKEMKEFLSEEDRRKQAIDKVSTLLRLS